MVFLLTPSFSFQSITSRYYLFVSWELLASVREHAFCPRNVAVAAVCLSSTAIAYSPEALSTRARQLLFQLLPQRGSG